MKIATKRLIIRDIKMKDAKSIAENANNREVWYFTEHIPYPYKLKDAKEFIKRQIKNSKEKPRKSYEFGIELKPEKQVIGLIGLFDISREHKKGGIGYWLGKRYRNQGIVSEAEKAVLGFAFNKLKLNKVHGDAMISNKASNRLFKKFGFRKVGILKEELIKKGKKLDGFRWELLKKNYKSE